MGRRALWVSIANALKGDIAEGRYAMGDKLPTESQLAASYGVNRHTVRRALAQLADEGLVHARRGSGVYVAAEPTDYPIGQRVRFNQSISASGRVPRRKLLALTTRAAGEPEAAALALDPGVPVHVCDTLSLIDGQPAALAQHTFPAARLPGLPAALEAHQSITRAMALCGIEDYIRLSTRITAKLASPTQAAHLQITEGAPILRTVSINTDLDDIPIEFGRTWFAGDRVTLTVGQDD